MGFLVNYIAKLICEQGKNILVTVHKQTTLAPFLECYREKNLLMTPLDITDLEKIEQKKLKFFTLTHYDLPESTSSLAAQQSVEPIKQLLTACEQTRPEVWKFIVKHIKTTVSQRTIRNDTDY